MKFSSLGKEDRKKLEWKESLYYLQIKILTIYILSKSTSRGLQVQKNWRNILKSKRFEMSIIQLISLYEFHVMVTEIYRFIAQLDMVKLQIFTFLEI